MAWYDNLGNYTPGGAMSSAFSGDGTRSDQTAAAALTGPAQSNYKYHFGDWISGVYSAARQQAAQNNADYAEWVRNEYSAAQQRQFQEYMDSTKVQRTMKDLEAAGLNPWLAVQSAGFGGSTPVAAAATSSAGQMSGSTGSSAASAVGLAALLTAVARIIKAAK